MKTNRLPIMLVFAAAALLAGCQSVASRIREKPEVFAQADKATQEKIKQGVVDLGYTQDMVYLALGNPDEKREVIRADGKTSVWIYNTYYTRYEGTVPVGYYRHVRYDRFLRAYRIYYEPAFADAYRDEKEERIRVTFRDGRTTAIEQASG